MPSQNALRNRVRQTESTQGFLTESSCSVKFGPCRQIEDHGDGRHDKLEPKSSDVIALLLVLTYDLGVPYSFNCVFILHSACKLYVHALYPVVVVVVFLCQHYSTTRRSGIVTAAWGGGGIVFCDLSMWMRRFLLKKNSSLVYF